MTFACSDTIIVPEIVITTDTKIDATGQTVVLSGNNANRVLSVSGARLDVIHLTITGGKAFTVGGLLASIATVTLTNSTVAGDSDLYYSGSAHAWYSTITLTNSTVSANAAEFGGGLATHESTITLINNIVATQAAGADCYGETGPAITSTGYNLDSDGTCGLTGTVSRQSVTQEPSHRWEGLR